MGTQQTADEIKDLKACLNDLIAVLALPAIWSIHEPSQIVSTLLEALVAMLRLDFAYVRLGDSFGRGAPIEMARFTQSKNVTLRPHEIGQALTPWLTNGPHTWPFAVPNPIGEGEISISVFRLGVQDELGVLVVGSRRADFATEIERLLLRVTANQAAIWLQEARLLREQRRVAEELDRRVAHRTQDLAATNEALQKEIAERKRTEEDLRRSEAFLADAQQLSRTGSFYWGVATDEITWSEQLYRIFEFEPGTPVTIERIVSRVHPEDVPMLNEWIERARSGGEHFEYPHRLLMPDGSVKHLNAIAHGSRDSVGQLEYIGAVQDVTQRRSSEEALAKAQSELARVARVTSLGVLTASIAHEVNQPLSGIMTNAGTCLRMLSADPPNLDGARETVRRTMRDSNRAAEVITRLRVLFSKREPTAESVDLNESIREVIALSLGELQKSRVIVQTELADDLSLVTGDRVQLQQVVLNLLLNALDAMKGVNDRPRQLVIKTERREGDWVCVSVRDFGVGVEPQAVEKLFEAFYTTKHDGMGMGLSVSRSIIESHHGRLWVATNDGPGATFSFSIPCRTDTKVQ